MWTEISERRDIFSGPGRLRCLAKNSPIFERWPEINRLPWLWKYCREELSHLCIQRIWAAQGCCMFKSMEFLVTFSYNFFFNFPTNYCSVDSTCCPRPSEFQEIWYDFFLRVCHFSFPSLPTWLEHARRLFLAPSSLSHFPRSVGLRKNQIDLCRSTVSAAKCSRLCALGHFTRQDRI